MLVDQGWPFSSYRNSAESVPTKKGESIKGVFTLNDSVTISILLTGGTYDLLDWHCDRQIWLHTHFAYQCNVCCGDGVGVTWCERALS